MKKAPVTKQDPETSAKPDQTPPPATSKVDSGALHKISLKINQTKEKPDPANKRETLRPSDNPSENFSREQFNAAWSKIAESYKDNSLALFLAMTRYKPAITQSGSVKLTVDNAIQADLVQEKKPEILSALRQALKNYQIDIETRIATKKRADKAYLPTEKLQKLIQKNPMVEKLQKTLGLDLEY